MRFQDDESLHDCSDAFQARIVWFSYYEAMALGLPLVAAISLSLGGSGDGAMYADANDPAP